MKNKILWSLGIVYVLIAIMVTVYLLNHNDYAVSQIGENTFLVMEDKMGEFSKGSLVIVKKPESKEIEAEEYIFFYDTADVDNVVKYKKVIEKNQLLENEVTFAIEDHFTISDEYIIGKGESSLSLAYVGSIFNLLSSQWGFLFLIIIPISLLFISQVYFLSLEIKKRKVLKKD